MHLDTLERPAAPDALVPRPTPVERRAVTMLPTAHGAFRTVAYRDEAAGVDHLALVADGTPPGEPPLVRVHSECLTGEAFGSLKCDCGPQLQAALEMIHEHGGVVLYLRGHEGRGIGLANKISAYRLQESGADTLAANLELGLPADARDYRAAAEMLDDLGIGRVRLITNNPDKVAQLAGAGIDVDERVGLVVGVGPHNRQYLETKRERMGHLIPDPALV